LTEEFKEIAHSGGQLVIRVLLAIERSFRGGKPGRSLQILVEPPTNHIMLVFLVWVQLPLVTEIPDCMEHSECPFRIVVGVSHYES
jgi:hypothetical protein